MDNQSSKYIIPYSIGLVIALASMLVFVYVSDFKGWFNNTDELVDSITLEESAEDNVVSLPTSNTIQQITQADLDMHNISSDCYTAINNNVYMLSSDFLESDKDDVFDELVCGFDITESFETQIKYTLDDIAEFLIGELVFFVEE